ncbi:MAG: hypothetical protein HOC78_03195 [Candidatus Komeilibacteria bacterium]|jgi:hypothetical protein|nr:hypothetical protein [Candidatus Komeilibacteria bacterium]
MKSKKQKMQVVAVDMGYGHQRAAYPFTDSAYRGIINANHYQGISKAEQREWDSGRKWYEIISRFKNVPILGTAAFAIMNHFQEIEPLYPKRDLSKNSQQQKYFYKQVKKGLGKRLIEELNSQIPKGHKKPLPFLTTFFVPAYFAEYYGYKNDIYLVVCDADVARAWAAYDAKKSRINYLVPNKRVKERLQLYGVRASKIYITGFPLPKENIGGYGQKILRSDIAARLYNLDPKGVYRKKYDKLIEDYLGPVKNIKKPKHPLTITFAVGGAGAQRDIGVTILNKLHKYLKTGKIRLNLIAGVRNDVYLYYQKVVSSCNLGKCKHVNLVYAEDKTTYFKIFNKLLRTTDILWTKPSELTFYSGLGLPIIMSEPIGSQENYNRGWLLAVGAGVDSLDPKYVDEWLFDWLDSGWLAEAAMEGFLDAPKMGTYHIENIVLKHKTIEIEDVHLL